MPLSELEWKSNKIINEIASQQIINSEKPSTLRDDSSPLTVYLYRIELNWISESTGCLSRRHLFDAMRSQSKDMSMIQKLRFRIAKVAHVPLVVDDDIATDVSSNVSPGQERVICIFPFYDRNAYYARFASRKLHRKCGVRCLEFSSSFCHTHVHNDELCKPKSISIYF